MFYFNEKMAFKIIEYYELENPFILRTVPNGSSKMSKIFSGQEMEILIEQFGHHHGHQYNTNNDKDAKRF
jgi:hypothetical protein